MHMRDAPFVLHVSHVRTRHHFGLLRRVVDVFRLVLAEEDEWDISWDLEVRVSCCRPSHEAGE